MVKLKSGGRTILFAGLYISLEFQNVIKCMQRKFEEKSAYAQTFKGQGDVTLVGDFHPRF